MRSVAAASAPPTASTSIALIGTSIRCGPSRSSWPTRIETATRTPRLHQVRPTRLENPTASSTPAVTLATRCTPLVTMSLSVTSTTSSAVSGARIGTVFGKTDDRHDVGGDGRAGEPDGTSHRGPAAQPEPDQARIDETFDGGDHDRACSPRWVSVTRRVGECVMCVRWEDVIRGGWVRRRTVMSHKSVPGAEVPQEHAVGVPKRCSKGRTHASVVMQSA